jgi:hypothetical protein
MTAREEQNLSEACLKAVEQLRTILHACEDTLKAADEIGKMGFSRRPPAPAGGMSVLTFENCNGMLAIVDENGRIGTCVYRTKDGQSLVIRQSAMSKPGDKTQQTKQSAERYVHAESRSSRTTQRICINANLDPSASPIRFHARPREVRMVIKPTDRS